MAAILVTLGPIVWPYCHDDWPRDQQQDFEGRAIDSLPGILVKSQEQARGLALAGVSVKVSDGIFLVGLSNVDSDKTRNLQLLRERGWFDVPIVYNSKHRAIMAIEQVSPRHKLLETAFGFWEQTALMSAQ